MFYYVLLIIHGAAQIAFPPSHTLHKLSFNEFYSESFQSFHIFLQQKRI